MVNTRNKQAAKKAKTTNPRKSLTKPRTIPEPPPSLTTRFLNNAARHHFKEIKTYRVIQERAFNLTKLVHNPDFDHQIRTKGWELLNGMVFEKANKTITLGFYANARHSGKKYESFVRGKVIDYIPEAINKLCST